MLSSVGLAIFTKRQVKIRNSEIAGGRLGKADGKT